MQPFSPKSILALCYIAAAGVFPSHFGIDYTAVLDLLRQGYVGNAFALEKVIVDNAAQQNQF